MKAMRWVAGGLMLLVIGAWVLDFGLGAMQAAAGGRHAITVSYETTRITEPRHPDGGVDYLAALNQQAAQGVTPENNAVVELLHAFGPAKIPSELRPAFFQMLGMEPLPDEGPYFVSFEDYCRQTLAEEVVTRDTNGDGPTDLIENLWSAQYRPWTSDSFPQVAAWLTVNQAALERIVAASQRPRYFCPLICKRTTSALVTADTPTVDIERAAARVLVTRAMLRLGAGDVDAAWQDALACHRLSRLIGQGPMLLAAMRAFATSEMAHSVNRVILVRNDLTTLTLRQMMDELSKLPRPLSFAECMDRSERFMSLDLVQCTAAEGPTFLEKVTDLGGNKTNTETTGSLDQFSAVVFDYDAIMRTQNAWIDRSVRAMREPTWLARRTAIRAIQTELVAQSKQSRGVVSIALSFLASPRKSLSDGVGQILVSLSLESLETVAEVEVRANVRCELIQLGLVLAQYRVEKGEYPNQLADLVPQYIAAIPVDPFADRPFLYRKQPRGFTLYSVGRNGQDDGGWGYRDYESDRDVDPGEDDIVVCVPLNNRQREPQ